MLATLPLYADPGRRCASRGERGPRLRVASHFSFDALCLHLHRPSRPPVMPRLLPRLPALLLPAGSQHGVQRLVDAAVKKDAFLKALAGGVVRQEKAKLKRHVSLPQ